LLKGTAQRQNILAPILQSNDLEGKTAFEQDCCLKSRLE
jgi:hypothetical protein